MAESSSEFDRVDRSVFSVVSLDDPPDDVEYWLSRSPEERLRGIELLRWMNYGPDACTAGLQRALEVAQRP